MQVKYKYLILLLFSSCLLAAGQNKNPNMVKSSVIDKQKSTTKKKKKRKKTLKIKKKYSKEAEFFAGIFEDILYLHKNIFTWSTYKVLLALFPPFIVARMIDEDLSNHFFDKNCWKNKNQLPYWCHEAAQWGVGVPIAVLGSFAFFANDPDYRTTGRIFLIGMPFVIFGKELLKTFRAKACLRPWHEKFCKDGKRKFGGFPSGHMAEALYMTVLFGVRYGPKFAIPLGLLSAFIAGVFVNCNRHYVSQIVAGASLGTIYALAADRLIDTRLCQKYEINCSIDAQGSPGVKISYRF